MSKPFAAIAAFIAMLVAAVAGLRRLFRSREEIPWEDSHRPGKILVVDGVGIHYVENAPSSRGSRGGVPSLVMIHGFGGNTFSYRYQLAEFGKDYRAVAFDLKGFGYSERSDKGDYSITEQARLVLRAMDILGIEKATVIGHSLGGEVAMRIAATAPERVEKLVLAASVSGVRAPIMPRLPIFRPTFGFFTKLAAVNAWRRMFYDRSKIDEKAVRAGYLEPGRINGSLNTVWELWDDVRSDKPIDYKRISMPVLILWAEKERVLPLAGRALRHLRKRLPHAEVITIPRTGHLLLEENAPDSNEALRRFFAGTPQTTPANVDRVAQPA